MKNSFFLLLLACVAVNAAMAQTPEEEAPQAAPAAKIPFDGMNLSWINGQNRQTDFPLALRDKKTDEVILTGVAFVDAYYNYDFNKPVDNTHTISSTIGRDNEITLNQVSIGLDASYKNAIGRVLLQWGQSVALVQDLDATVAHGRNTSISNLKYIREAAAGYHFNKWYGLNVEAGIFMSYIGLESYVLNENWCYQRSMPCEFTPFYFSGARVQAFLTKKLKQEIWLLNGWQTYNNPNQQLGFGSSTYWRANENLQIVANFYLGGHDTRGAGDLLRFHHDNSINLRYYHPAFNKGGISQAAFSLNNHYGFESGAGIGPSEHRFIGVSLANRVWWAGNKLALTIRGDYVNNPGAYLAYNPSPVAPNDYLDALAAGNELKLFQGTATFDMMPNQFVTFRLEYGYRSSNGVPYFAGNGGTTSPDGWVNTPAGTWRPDLVKSESRLTAAVSFRL